MTMQEEAIFRFRKLIEFVRENRNVDKLEEKWSALQIREEIENWDLTILDN